MLKKISYFSFSILLALAALTGCSRSSSAFSGTTRYQDRDLPIEIVSEENQTTLDEIDSGVLSQDVHSVYGTSVLLAGLIKQTLINEGISSIGIAQRFSLEFDVIDINNVLSAFSPDFEIQALRSTLDLIESNKTISNNEIRAELSNLGFQEDEIVYAISNKDSSTASAVVQAELDRLKLTDEELDAISGYYNGYSKDNNVINENSSVAIEIDVTSDIADSSDDYGSSFGSQNNNSSGQSSSNQSPSDSSLGTQSSSGEEYSHIHDWTTVTETRYVPESGHYDSVLTKAAWDEQVLLREAWDEQVIVKYAETEYRDIYETTASYHVCGCGASFATQSELTAHQIYYADLWDEGLISDEEDDLHSCSSIDWEYTVVDTEIIYHPAEYETIHHEAEYETIHHDAEYTKKWVIDTPAHNEMVTYEVCTICGERR